MSSLPASIKRIGSKTTEKRWRHRFPHYKSMGAFCCHGNQSFEPICPKTLCSLSPPLVMLHINFDQDWPTGFRDIQVWKCGRQRTTTDDDGRTTDHWYTIQLTLWAFGSGELKSWVACPIGYHDPDIQLWWEPNLSSMKNIWLVSIFLSPKATPLFALIQTQGEGVFISIYLPIRLNPRGGGGIRRVPVNQVLKRTLYHLSYRDRNQYTCNWAESTADRLWNFMDKIGTWRL